MPLVDAPGSLQAATYLQQAQHGGLEGTTGSETAAVAFTNEEFQSRPVWGVRLYKQTKMCWLKVQYTYNFARILMGVFH